VRLPGSPERAQRSSRALALSGVGEKGGARLLGRAAVRPFYNTINHLRIRLRTVSEPAVAGPAGFDCFTVGHPDEVRASVR
jgi:hypothetical protein